MDTDGRKRLDTWVDPVLVNRVRQVSEAIDQPVAEVVRRALRVFSAALLAELGESDVVELDAGEATVAPCLVCGTPRRPDAVQDAMAHAQCAAIMANLAKVVDNV
jgi:hypothetical protein